MTTRYGYLGPAGTFSEAALCTLDVSTTAELVACPSVSEALDAVRRGELVAALVPLENSVEGSVATTLDELATDASLVIEQEVLLPVSFALLGRSGTTLGDVATVTTIPHAEAQVRGWLRRELPTARFVPAASTADGARAVAAGEADAAVASPLAAERYALEVLASDIHDVDGAVTRFVVVVRAGTPPAQPTGADRTTVVAFIADDHPGALLEILTEFAVRGVNLTRIESRPTGVGIGRYYFSMDCEGHIADARVGEALSALRRVCADVHFLGSYPRADGAAPVVRRGTDDRDFEAAADWLERLRAGDT
ncbi:MAG: prephenate dehydratase [Actinomycetes bacterium]